MSAHRDTALAHEHLLPRFDFQDEVDVGDTPDTPAGDPPLILSSWVHLEARKGVLRLLRKIEGQEPHDALQVPHIRWLAVLEIEVSDEWSLKCIVTHLQPYHHLNRVNERCQVCAPQLTCSSPCLILCLPFVPFRLEIRWHCDTIFMAGILTASWL